MEGIYHKDIPNIFIMIGLPGSGKVLMQLI